jgi:hypothetical protein
MGAGFSPGVGVIAMASQEDAEAFWIIRINSSSGRALARAVGGVSAGV